MSGAFLHQKGLGLALRQHGGGLQGVFCKGEVVRGSAPKGGHAKYNMETFLNPIQQKGVCGGEIESWDQAP